MISTLVLCLSVGLPFDDAALAALDGGARGEAQAARAALLALRGEERAAAVASLLEDFGDRPPGIRGRRAQVLADLAAPRDHPALLALLDDGEPRVRAAILQYLVRPDLGSVEPQTRVPALALLAREDADASLRRLAIDALGGLDTAEAVAVLGALIDELPRPERGWAVAALPASRRSARLVATLVAPDRRPATPPDVLAALLPLHGRLLVDGHQGPGAAVPIAIALKHPDPGVRSGAIEAFLAVVSRFRELGATEAPRAHRVLAEFAEAGVDPRLVHHHRAGLALFPGVDPVAAREAARAIRGGDAGAAAGARLEALAGGDLSDAGLWAFRSYWWEGLAEFALGNLGPAGASFELAAAALDGALAARLDLEDEVSLLQHVDLLHQRALVEVGLALVELGRGGAPGDRIVVEHALLAHRLTLEAQVGYARVHGEARTGWDALFDSELSPYRILFAGVSFPGLSFGQAIALQRDLGSALAAVAPREMPGFAPPAGLDLILTDPLEDPERRALLEEAALARLDGLADRIDRITSRISRRGGLGWERPEAELEELNLLDRRRQMLQVEWASGDQDQGLRELRVPGSQALWLARDLREEGRGPEARSVARAMQAGLEGDGISRWWYYHGQTLLVRCDLIIGAAFTDEDEPLRAQEALLAAIARLEGLERQLADAGASAADLAPYHSLRSTALVSLAVNANVKLGRPEEALEYYEGAYALRKDDFMTVLLACYRARSGREQEARDLVRLVRPGPQTWYNLACTHALLGDTEVALDWLETELDENHASEAARNRQRAWARSDPDLASLREDPRFGALVGERSGK